jgi:hypothetical protein
MFEELSQFLNSQLFGVPVSIYIIATEMLGVVIGFMILMKKKKSR